MTNYRIEAKTPGRDWRTLGTERDDIARHEYNLSAERLAHIVANRLAAEYPDSEFRAVPCEVTR
jgi:hypothetical protein